MPANPSRYKFAPHHEIAEYGVAALGYKQGKNDEDALAKRLEWIKKHILDFHSLSGGDADSFIDIIKNDLFSERVFCYTPNGKIINLPKGSTPIDFAYQVREIGHTCMGARVDGRMVNLSYQLENGQRVEIITRKDGQPSPDWENLVKTRSAKQKIRQVLRQKLRHEQLEAGRRKLERALRRHKLSVSSYMVKSRLEQAAKKLLRSENVDELLLAVINDRMPTRHVIEALVPELKEKEKIKEEIKESLNAAKANSAKSNDNSDIYLEGFLNAPIKLALCCKPVHDDTIIGFITRGRGVTVHSLSCNTIQRLISTETERLITAQWKAKDHASYSVDFEIAAYDRSGLLMNIMQVVADMQKTASKVNAEVTGDKADIFVRVEVKNLSELDHIKQTIANIKGVIEIHRTKLGIKKKP
ncbi:MAG: TGS domain-containing protein [Deinococcales bacterium]